jgi:hypothetical protein
MGKTYDEPGGDFFKPAENVERLLLIEVLSYREDYDNPYAPEEAEVKTRDGIEAVVTALDGDGAPVVYTQSTIHQGGLIKVLKGKKVVLGRLGKGTASARGRQAPYILEKPTAEDREIADKYLAAQGEPPF